MAPIFSADLFMDNGAYVPSNEITLVVEAKDGYEATQKLVAYVNSKEFLDNMFGVTDFNDLEEAEQEEIIDAITEPKEHVGVMQISR